MPYSLPGFPSSGLPECPTCGSSMLGKTEDGRGGEFFQCPNSSCRTKGTKYRYDKDGELVSIEECAP